MNSFEFNGVYIRFFESGNYTYFVTSDANDACGFKGNDTLLDKMSMPIATVLNTEMDKYIPSLDFLSGRTLVIEKHKAFIAVARSSNPETPNRLLHPEILVAIANQLDSLLGTDHYLRSILCFIDSQVAAIILEDHYPGRFRHILAAAEVYVPTTFLGITTFKTFKWDARIDKDCYHFSVLDSVTNYILDFQIPYWADKETPLTSLGGNPRYVYQPANRRIRDMRVDVLPDYLRSKLQSEIQGIYDNMAALKSELQGHYDKVTILQSETQELFDKINNS
jgi:hypothetical protein